MEMLAGFLLGFLGSFHCVAMCGPIALSLPGKSRTKFDFILERIFYNFGRVTTYTFTGILLGLFSERIFIGGIQQVFSLSIGTAIIFYLSGSILKKKKVNLYNPELKKSKFLFYKNLFIRLYSKNSRLSLFGIGLLNGFLPCGFVYIAVSGSMLIGSPLKGGIFMAMFGMGTLPLMIAVSLSKNFVRHKLRRKINILSHVIAVILAIIFMLRGLNLGIPFISPKILEDKNNIVEILCH